MNAALAELDRALGGSGSRALAIGSNIDGVALNDPRFEPLWARLDALRLPVFEHPMFPRDTGDLNEFELPLRVGLIFDTTLAAARMIYGGVFERYPNFPYIMAHTGGALLMMLERLDNGYRLFPDCRKYINRLPSEYAKRLYYDTTSFAEPSLSLALRCVGADHLLFGTDDPFIDADTRYVERLALPEADKYENLRHRMRQRYSGSVELDHRRTAPLIRAQVTPATGNVHCVSSAPHEFCGGCERFVQKTAYSNIQGPIPNFRHRDSIPDLR